MGTTRALITGISGQDGSYLSNYLKSIHNYHIVGVSRHNYIPDFVQCDKLESDIHLTNIANTTLSLQTWIECLHGHDIDEIYHLAGQTCKMQSCIDCLGTMMNTGVWTCVILEAIHQCQMRFRKKIKFFHASSSEIFGYATGFVPQTEHTPHQTLSPYAIAKLQCYHAVQYYRRCHDLFAVSGILYNHESERRGAHFVTSKIVHGVADIVRGRATKLQLGSLSVRRDWSDARDFVRAMHLCLQQEESQEYIICSGIQHTVEEFCCEAFKYVGLDYLKYIESNDPRWTRVDDLYNIVGDNSKIKALGWTPEISFYKMIHDMVDGALMKLSRN